MATKTSLLGLTKPAYTDAADVAVLNGNFDLIDKAVGQGARVGNLLDNSWFGNPINQRGSTEVSTDSDSYFIDRWVGYQGTFSLRNNSIQIQANRQYGALLQQFVQKLEDGVYTFAGKVDGSIVWRIVQISGNTVTTLDNNNASFSNGAGYLYVQTQGDKVYNFHFRANVGYTIVVEWAALYEGAYTADTLPAYVYKGYAAELAECQRYFQKGGQVVTVGTQYGTATKGIIRLRFCGMRSMPNITITGISSQGWGNIALEHLSKEWTSQVGTDCFQNYMIEGDSSFVGQTIGVEYEASADL